MRKNKTRDAPMKLPELKRRTEEAWQDLHESYGAIATGSCKDEVRANFGDLRKRSTWVQALASFEARFHHAACLDAWSLILHSFNVTPDRWDYEIRHEFFEAFLQLPDGLELLKMGLEQLFTYFTAEEQECNGFLELVSEQRERRGFDAVGLIGRQPADLKATAS